MKRIVSVIILGLLVAGCGLGPDTSEADSASVGQRNQQVSQPQEMRPMVARAVNLIQSGDIGGGLRALDEAIMADPRDIQAYTLLGQAYLHLNQLDRAFDTFGAGLRVDPDHGELHYMVAIVNGLNGRRDLAIESAERALAIFQQERDEDNFRRTLGLLQGLSQE